MTQQCPIDAPIREAIKANVSTLCSECAHVLDDCKGVEKSTATEDGYTAVKQCAKYQLDKE